MNTLKDRGQHVHAELIHSQKLVETFQVDDGSRISGLLQRQNVMGIIHRAGFQMWHEFDGTLFEKG